tara:strand:- start:1256 stop:1561 length:306 start_codon:yes stop_codon:yes gene_type:complete
MPINGGPSNGSNGIWKTIAILALGGGLGAGAGSISGAWADTEAIQAMVASSPALVILQANQATIKEDLKEIRVEQKEQRATTSEIDRKLNRVLVIVERESR